MTFTSKPDFLPYIFVYALLSLLVLQQTWTRKSAGIGLSYVFQLWLLYGAGACLHALPWSELPATPQVFDGFVISTYGMVAFALGWCAHPYLFDVRVTAVKAQNARLAGLYLLTGVVFYFAITPLVGGLPTLTALTSVGQQLSIIGICLGSWIAWHERGWNVMIYWCAPALAYPLVTVANQGFLGFGVMALGIVAIFCGTFVRPRWTLALITAIAVYGGLCVYTAYMRDRSEIRASVWGGESISSRLDRIGGTMAKLEAFDIHNQRHLEAFDSRLNQNIFIGMAYENLSHSGDFARGGTLREAVLSLVPRALWPDKPMSAGSGNLVSRFTGVEFAAGTSVGVGAVLELYVNYGIASVVIGFALLGMLLSYADTKAGKCLSCGDWQGFATWFLFGISFLQVGGSFVEVSATAGASVLVAKFINSVLASYVYVKGRWTPVAVAGDLSHEHPHDCPVL